MMALQKSRDASGQPRQSRGPGSWRFPWTIRHKLISLTAGLVVLFIWALAYISVAVLQDHFDEVILEQQLALTQQVAAELENKLEDRIRFLTRAAGFVPSDLTPGALDAFLAQRTSLHVTFSAGISVIGLDGITIADYPVAPGRRGTYFGDRDYFLQVAATRKPYIGKPVMGRALQRPVLTIAVPVLDPAGKLRAVMTGVTDMAAPNFLGTITDRALTGQGEFFVLSRDERILVASTDSSRALMPISERGTSPILDRFVDGFEGSGFGVSSRGIPKLYSAKGVSSANWVVIAALPADIARKPLLVMQRYLYIGAGFITILAVLALWWMTRRVLAPLEKAGTTIRRMTSGEIPMAPLPVQGQDEVGQLIDNFNQLVDERRRYEERLDAANQELHAFTYAASHDMKGPMGRINTFSSLLERDYRDRLDGDGLLFLDLIRRNAKRLMALVEGLLVHAEFGQKSLVLQPVGLRQAVDEVLTEFEEEIRQGGVEVRLDMADLAVLANPQALAQVLRNLLENALRYSSAAKTPLIEIGSHAREDGCRVWVRDNGIGFDMVYHDRIFEVLRRLHTYEEFPGSGVGLALVKKAMECMGGKVWAESEPGQGATFYLQLRLAE